MTVRHLKIFVTVCKAGSMTKASEILFLAQPSISLAISELEKNYNVRLFDRIGKKIFITSQGEQFLSFASHIVNLFDELELTFKNRDFTTEVRVGSNVTIGNFLLPSLIKEFNSLFPDIKTRVLISNTENIEKSLLENKIDVGIIEGASQNPFIISEFIRMENLLFLCNPTHPWAGQRISLDEFSKASLLLRERGSAVRAIFDEALSKNKIRSNILWESASTSSLLRAVELNLGITVLPLLTAEKDIIEKRVSTFQVEHMNLERKIAIAIHKNKYISESLKAFVDLMKSSITDIEQSMVKRD